MSSAYDNLALDSQKTAQSPSYNSELSYQVPSSNLISKATSYDAWCDKIARKNPVIETDSVNNAATNQLQGHFNEYVNGYKECFIWVGKMNSPFDVTNSWKNQSKNGFLQVSPKVKLYCDETNINYSYNHEIEIKDLVSEFFEGNSILSGAKNILDTARHTLGDSSVYIKRFSGAPLYKKTSSLSIGQGIKFSFHFGDFGLFSGFEEVVKPIIALASFFALSTSSSYSEYLGNNLKNSAGSAVMSLKTPYPTKNQFIATHIADSLYTKDNLKQLGSYMGDSLKELGGAIVDFFKKDPGNAINRLKSSVASASAFEASLMELASAGVVKVVNNENYKIIHIKIGHFYIGPCVVKQINYSFNTETLDEYGWPSQGYITLGGIETLEVASVPLIANSVLRV